MINGFIHFVREPLLLFKWMYGGYNEPDVIYRVVIGGSILFMVKKIASIIFGIKRLHHC